MPKPATKRRLWLWGAAGLLGLALAGFVWSQFWMASQRPPTVPSAEPVRQPFGPGTQLQIL